MFLDFLFIASALMAMVGAAFVLSVTNIMHACMALLISLLGVAGLYFSMGADFVGAVQIMVYAGGVVILMLFAVMLTGGKNFVSKAEKLLGLIPGMGNKWSYGVAAVTVLSFLYVVGQLVSGILDITTQKEEAFNFTSTAEEIGRLLVTDHILVFELSSVLLLGALVGAAMISRPNKTVVPQQHGSTSSSEVNND